MAPSNAPQARPVQPPDQACTNKGQQPHTRKDTPGHYHYHQTNDPGCIIWRQDHNRSTFERNFLANRETLVEEKINFYRTTAAAEGGITGAGGLLLGLADFPLLIGIKLKLLFEIAALYGYPVEDYKERLYILHIFQLAFSSQQQRREVYPENGSLGRSPAMNCPQISMNLTGVFFSRNTATILTSPKWPNSSPLSAHPLVLLSITGLSHNQATPP